MVGCGESTGYCLFQSSLRELRRFRRFVRRFESIVSVHRFIFQREEKNVINRLVFIFSLFL